MKKTIHLYNVIFLQHIWSIGSSLLFLVLLLIASSNCLAGAHYIYASTSGFVTISNSSTSPALVGGDTLDIQDGASFIAVQYQHLNGTAGNPILIRWLGTASITYPAGIFQQPVCSNVSFVIVTGQKYYNWYGKMTMSNTIHDLTYSYCTWINPAGSYKDQPPIQWDDANPSMVFTGLKSQTFYNIKYNNCKWDGYANVSVLNVGTAWGKSEEINRSIATDWEMANDTFQNITNTAPITVGAISATGWRWKIHNCLFNLILGPGSVQNSHSQAVLFYGSVDFYNNRQNSSYASILRCVPLSWNGLPGYAGNGTAVRAWNNIITNSLSYSAFEFGQNNTANRQPTQGIYPTQATCVYNTVYNTVRHSYNGDYYGFIADNVNQDTLLVAYNYIMLPERDRPFDLAGRGYIVSTVGAPPAHQMVTGNQVFETWNNTITEDLVSFTPAAGSPLLNKGTAYNFRTSDFYGNPIPINGGYDIGAVERQAVSLIPGCTVNSSPANNTTLPTSSTATLTWAAASNAASYDVYVWTGVTPPATPIANVTATTYDAQGLTAATIYNWYVVPKNAAGSSTGCDASKTTFKTNQLPVAIVTPPSKTLILPTNSVTLDGSASYDPDGTISQYYWSMYSGPSTPTFNPFNPSITLSGLVEGTYIFMLQAKDNNGTPNWASCTITVSPSSGGGNQNIDPKPYPGPNQIIYLPNNSASRSTSLNGSESYDPDGSIEAYYWEQVNVQNSPNICTITDPTSITGITTATNLLQGTYYFRLHVRDNNHVVVVSDIKTVEVRSSSSTNVLPQALPGRDLTITYPANAVLNGSTSYDPDGFIEAYYWVQVDPQSSPNTCTITNQTSPSGITTATNLLPGTYYFVLHVRDNNHVVVVSARKKVTVTATSLRVMISPTTTEATKDAGRLRIYPNPLKTGTASIEINSGGKGLKTISLYNSTGVLVRKYTWQTIKGKNIFSLKNISDLTAGVYMVDIRDEHGKSVGNLKFIKQ